MFAGVIIERGASPCQIFQQGPEGTAPIRLEGTYHLDRLSQELQLAFSEVPPAPAPARPAARPRGHHLRTPLPE